MFIINVLQIIQDSVEDLFRKYLPMMRGLARSILKDFHLSEDAVQEALVKLYRYSDKIDNIDSKATKNYVYTVIRNESISIKRKEERRNLFETDVQFSEETALNNIEGQLDIEEFRNKYGFSMEVSDMLDQLSLTDKDILTYKYSFGYSFKEISKMMDMSRDAVYKRHKRALDKLRSILEAEDEK